MARKKEREEVVKGLRHRMILPRGRLGEQVTHGASNRKGRMVRKGT